MMPFRHSLLYRSHEYTASLLSKHEESSKHDTLLSSCIAVKLMILASDCFHRVMHLLAVEQGTFVVIMFDVLLDYDLLDNFSYLAIFVIIFDVRVHFTCKTNEFSDDLAGRFIFHFTYDFYLICFSMEHLSFYLICVIMEFAIFWVITAVKPFLSFQKSS